MNHKKLVLTNKDIEEGKHREAVGGKWDEIGELQFDWFVKKGLKKENTFLDVGCGSLRGGIHFVNFLEKGNYYGIDINEYLIKAGKIELQKLDILNKEPTLIVNGDFNFGLFNQRFDFAFAQSVFTHLSLDEIYKCLVQIEKVLKSNGEFYATFFEAKNKKYNLESLNDLLYKSKNEDKDPYYYPFSVFPFIIRDLSLTVEYIGNWNHPRKQKMLLFKKKKKNS
ncbi:hypothetical protein BKP45_18980 [Anaerobacillus alkalidiazotrophicus]|uniref:Methyltransferase domain-containing protein n=1 Tax=Anaerobacillus alkalidiazotrophicus TaxID=472963 RepID=A0A1S2M1Z7_9BACI|nr:class I SAM-dependent methyltransferase [Anaerobacillus alkalidiazotrophicus]OIJ18530.1 hypothetical protein BKP45_18980 [Anaerobacillus alkalidiazotrophicus]